MQPGMQQSVVEPTSGQQALPGVSPQGRGPLHVSEPGTAAEPGLQPQTQYAERWGHLRSAVTQVKREVDAVALMLDSAQEDLAACMTMVDYLSRVDSQPETGPRMEAGGPLCHDQAPVSVRPSLPPPSLAEPSAAVSGVVGTTGMSAGSSSHREVTTAGNQPRPASTETAHMCPGSSAAGSSAFANRTEGLRQQLQRVRGRLKPLGTTLQVQDLRLSISIDMLQALAATGPAGEHPEAWARFESVWAQE